MMKKIRNLTMVVLMAVVTIVSVLYINDFRYNNEDGLYYIVERGSDYTKEERAERHISEDYTCRLSHIDDLGTVVYLLME